MSIQSKFWIPWVTYKVVGYTDALARLAIKVKDNVSCKTGCEVALKTLILYEYD